MATLKLGSIPLCLPLRLSVSWSYMLKIAGEIHPTNSQINSKQEKPTKILPIRNCKAKTPPNQLEYDSAFGLHSSQNPDCAAHYHNRRFSILAKAKTHFHLTRNYFYQNTETNFVQAERIRQPSLNYSIINH